jgi:hypothetical protein
MMSLTSQLNYSLNVFRAGNAKKFNQRMGRWSLLIRNPDL